MPARKMRVELFDSEGNKYSISFEGQISREKALRLLDLVELLGGVSGSDVNAESNPNAADNVVSKYNKLRTLVQKHFPLVWFSSKEVQNVYEGELKEPISLSTVATYFARMEKKGILVRMGNANRLKYKLAPMLPQAVIKPEKS